MCQTGIFRVYVFVAAAAIIFATGCTSPCEYVRNGFKVGPNYQPVPAPVAEQWIDQADFQQTQNPEILACWWKVFNDSQLNDLISCAFKQNLTLKEAGFRVLETRAQLGIARGDLFPQTQTMTGSYQRIAEPFNIPLKTPTGLPGFYDQWNYGFNLNWELDFWGRFRRAVIAADDNLQASAYGYDAVLVTLLGDLAQNYVRLRTDQERIKLLQANAELQRGILNVAAQLEARFRQTELDHDRRSAICGRPRPRSFRWPSTPGRPKTCCAS